MSDRHPPDHDPLIRRALGGDVPASDPEAKERARTQLRHHIDERHGAPVPGSRGRGRRVWVAASVAALLVVAAGIVVPRLAREPIDRADSSASPGLRAASALQRMMLVAAKQPAPAGVRYPIDREALLTEGATSSDGTSYTLLVRSTITGWIEADGSGRREATITDVRFASDDDRAAWIEMGSPPLPQVGEHRVERFGPGELLVDLSKLSTNVDELRRQLQDGVTGEFGHGPDNLLSEISRLLAQPDASPDLRAALFDLASTIDGAELIPDAVDPLGRPGIGVALDSESFRSSVILDPSTSEVLAFVDEPRRDNPGTVATWTAFLR